MTLSDDVAAHLGRPWNEDDWACWDLVRHFQRHFGRDALPVISGRAARSNFTLARTIARHPERQNWVRGDAEPGAVLLMARNDGGRGRELHAGIYLMFERPFVLHVDQPHGTLLDTVPMLAVRGWHTLNFYRHI